jgi:hypothetical protein
VKGEIVWLIRSQAAPDLLRIVERLRGHNLAPELQSSGEFRALGTTVEDAGESSVTTPSELFEQWESDHLAKVAFQLWRVENVGEPGVSGAAFIETDTRVTLERKENHSRLIFSLDGWTGDDAESLAATLLWNALTEPESLGLLIDRTAAVHREWEDYLDDPAAPMTPSLDAVWLVDDTFRQRIFSVSQRKGAWPAFG